MHVLQFLFSLIVCTFAARAYLIRTNAKVSNKDFGTYQDPQTVADRRLLVHLFEWKWTDIANECEQFLQYYGYGAVQISPPNEHILITSPLMPWWQRYQPVSYKLSSRSGSEDELRDMVTRCNNVGVRIIVDGVLNHMVGNGQSGTGSDGCSFVGQTSSENFPCVSYSSTNFNDAKCTSGDGNIDNWGDINQIKYCRLVGLLDLDQGQDYVRARMIDYLNALVDMGVAGFRLDAAKHMWPNDINTILAGVHDLSTNWWPSGQRPFVVQEVQQDNVVSNNDYYQNGRVTNFDYGNTVSAAVKHSQNFQNFGNFGTGWGMPADNDILNFIDNHDSQRSNSAVLTYKNGAQYSMAVSFMLAWPYGYVRVMSSYYFDSSDQNPPMGDGPDYEINSPVIQSDETCDPSSGWVCEHRWPVIRNMALFHSEVEGTDVGNIVTNNNQIAFSRTGKGFFALNNDYSTWSAQFQTALPAGAYCDVISGSLKDNTCTGQIYVVGSNGLAFISVSAGSQVALHTGAMLTGSYTAATDLPAVSTTTGPANWQRTVIFIHKQTDVGQDLFIRGGIDHSRLNGCTFDASTSKCATPIKHKTIVPSSFSTYIDWSLGDGHLDWYGAEKGQGMYNGQQAQGTPLAWSTNDQNTLGYQPLNTYGPHFWIVDTMMDCSQAYSGKYFELKAYLQGGDGWEANINQNAICSGSAGFTKPFDSINHIGMCGKINVYEFGAGSCTISNFQ